MKAYDGYFKAIMIYPGLKVGGYVIEDELGRGGFGSVYLAVDEVSGQRVAIKFLHPKSMRSETAQQTFIDEMINQARLSLNPNIVHIIRSIRYTEKQGQHLGMVMEYVDGEPLDMIIHRFSLLPASAAVPVFLQVLNGLSYAHDQNMLHRDLKPGNIMVGKDGLVKIMDFGLSKLVQGSTAASESARAASLNYVAPERLAKHHVDQRSDIYSLGATLYEALTGVPPYEIEPGNWQMASEKHNSGMFADIRKHYEYHPAELALLVKKSLDPDPAKRFATAREMLQALQQVPIESHKASTLPMELAAVTDTAGKLGLITKVIPDKPDAKPATIIDSQVDDAPAINVAPSTPAGTIANFEKTISPDVSQQKSSEQLVPDASQTGMKKNNRLLPVGAAVVLAIFVLVVVFAGQANKKEKEQLAAEQELRWRQEQVRAEEYAARERMKEVKRQRQELLDRQQQQAREEQLRQTVSGSDPQTIETLSERSDLSFDGVGEVIGGSASRYNQEGLQFCNRGDFAAAVTSFKKAAKANPDNAEYWNNIGYAYQKIDKYVASNHFCEKALEISPDRAVAFGNMAFNCVKLNKLDEAVNNWVTYLSKLDTEKKRQRGIDFMKQMVVENPDPRVGECIRRAFARMDIPYS